VTVHRPAGPAALTVSAWTFFRSPVASACHFLCVELALMRRRVSLVEGSPYSAFGAVTLGSHTYRRPRHRRRAGLSAPLVFSVLLVLAFVEAAWFLQPVWRGALAPAVVLAEATPADESLAVGESSALLLRRANEALLAGRWAEAHAAFDRAADLDAAPPAATLGAARMLLGTHRLDDAVYRARRAVALAPDSAEALTVLATALDWSGQAEEAVEVARRAHELAPGDVRAVAALAEASADRQELDDAEALIGEALERAPLDPEVHRVRGAIHEVRADYPGAVDAYRRALELEPGVAHRHLSLGLALRSLGNLEEAASTCNRAVDLSPSNARVYGCLGLVALARGQINRAVPLFEWALELDPRYPTAAAQLGWIASRRGDDARAAPLFEIAVATDRDPARLAQYRQALGWSYLRLGRGPLARDQFTWALRLDPSLQSAREGLAALGPVPVSSQPMGGGGRTARQ
jgi:tetratricopeptide (TPR) repeat protein